MCQATVYTCTYACVYCQLGRTTAMSRWRRAFYGAEAIVQAVSARVAEARARDQAIDYLTFVADGEPTLDFDLGAEIEGFRPLDLPIAVITNASFLWRADVREDLFRTDWVSLKVDATDEAIWRRIDRPHGRLELTQIREGLLAFARDLLSIIAVHPMRRGAVEALLERAGADWSAVEDMLARGQLIETAYGGATFYMRKLS